jgi:hypothetical protein
MAGSRSTAPLNRSKSVLIVARLSASGNSLTPAGGAPLVSPHRRIAAGWAAYPLCILQRVGSFFPPRSVHWRVANPQSFGFARGGGILLPVSLHNLLASSRYALPPQQLIKSTRKGSYLCGNIPHEVEPQPRPSEPPRHPCIVRLQSAQRRLPALLFSTTSNIPFS